jgi:hypothetical protein
MKACVLRLLLWGLLSGLAAQALRADIRAGDPIAHLKAVYLYHFAHFAEWPPEQAAAAKKSLRLCVIGDSEVAEQLLSLDTHELGEGILLRIARLHREELPDGCQMVFISHAIDFNIELVLARLRNAPLLSVSDAPGFARSGGMIEMFLRDDKIRMRVNLSAVQAAGLHLSSKLLRLAEIVESP